MQCQYFKEYFCSGYFKGSFGGVYFSPNIFLFDRIIEKLYHMLNFVGFCLGLEYSFQDYKHIFHSGKSYLTFQELFSYF